MSGVVVINPPNDPFSSEGLLIEPIDVLTVGTWISSLGYKVWVRDLDKERIDPDGIEGLLVELQPDVLVIPFDYHIPLYTAAAAKKVVEIISRARGCGVLVVVGGRPATANPGRFLIDEQVVVIRGEMELALREILSALYSGESMESIPGIAFARDGGVVLTEKRKELVELDLLPIPDRALLPVKNYLDVNTMLSSRGCVQKCSFCPVPNFWGRWRSRSPEKVVEEIRYLVERYGASKILLLDDHATADPRRMTKISELLAIASLPVKLGCLGTVRSFDLETLRKMREGGFAWIHYGCEFADDQVLRSLRKGISVSEIEEAICRTKEVGLRVRTSWIFDPPGATEDGLRQTYRLITALTPDEVRIHFLAIRDCSELSKSLSSTHRDENEQYIHCGRSAGNPFGVDSESTFHWSRKVAQSLSAVGYRVVQKQEEWLDREAWSGGDRFVSFCPGRYGVGWGGRA